MAQWSKQPDRKQKPRRPTARPSLIEGLESRRLLAAVDITDFGARPNDGRDDRAAIIKAINASAAGDTIVFPAGVWNISDEITIAANRTYQGAGADLTEINGRSREGQSFKVLGDNITITGITFHGGGIFLEKPGASWNNNIVIDYNVFEMNLNGGPHRNAITFTSGLKNSTISNNFFTGFKGGFGIYGYNYSNLTIRNNEFVNLNAGMHIDAFSAASGNLLIASNYIAGAKGMGVELQGTANGVSILDNYYEKPNLSSTFRDNDTTFAFSIILDKSQNIEIRRNTVIAPERPDGTGVRVGFEVGGDNTIVEDNYVNGINHVVASNDGVGTSSVYIRNNAFHDYRQWIGGLNKRAILEEVNNRMDPSELTWDINRPKPGIGGTYSGRSPDLGGGGIGTPGPAVPTGPADLKATASGFGRVILEWTDKASNETGFRVEMSYDEKKWTDIGGTRVNNTRFIKNGLPAGREIFFRVASYNAGGKSQWSEVVSITLQGSPLTGAPSAPTTPPSSSGGLTGGSTTRPVGGLGSSLTSGKNTSYDSLLN